MNVILPDYDNERLVAVETVADLVGTTAGPWGQNVDFHGKDKPIMIRDGYQVINNFEPPDGVLLSVVIRLKQMARTVAARAGDGTTTATLIMAACFRNAIMAIAGKSGGASVYCRRYVAAGIRQAAQFAIEFLRGMARKIDYKTEEGFRSLVSVCTIAGGNDAAIGKTVAEVLREIGPDGHLSSEYGPEEKSVSWYLKPGYRLPFGLLNPVLLPHKRNSVTVQDAYAILVKEVVGRIEDLKVAIGAWREVCQDAGHLRPLVLFCAGIEGTAMGAMLQRKDSEGRELPWYVVRVNGMPEVWEELSAVTGAFAVSSREGRSLAHFKKEKGAIVPALTLSMADTVISPLLPILEKSGLVDRLKDSLKAATADEKTAIEGRIARLEGRVAVIKAPAPTSARHSFNAEVIEDAYLAGVSAIKDGVLPGAGKALIEAKKRLFSATEIIPESSFDAGFSAFAESLPSVSKRLLSNGAFTPSASAGVLNALISAPIWHTLNLNDQCHEAISAGHDQLPVFAEHIRDAQEIGVLDSVTALCAAIEAAATEAADWVETSAGVAPSSYLLKRH